MKPDYSSSLSSVYFYSHTGSTVIERKKGCSNIYSFFFISLFFAIPLIVTPYELKWKTTKSQRVNHENKKVQLDNGKQRIAIFDYSVGRKKKDHVRNWEFVLKYLIIKILRVKDELTQLYFMFHINLAHVIHFSECVSSLLIAKEDWIKNTEYVMNQSE